MKLFHPVDAISVRRENYREPVSKIKDILSEASQRAVSKAHSAATARGQ